MVPEIDLFLAEIAALPEVVAAVKIDPTLLERFDDLDRFLRAFYVTGNDDPVVVDLFDRFRMIVRNERDRGTRARIVKIQILFNEFIAARARFVSARRAAA